MPSALARPRRLSRAEYDRLVETGDFNDQRVELIRGRVVEMSPQGAPHSWVVMRLNMLLTAALQGRALVLVQGPLAISDDSQPEPDVAVLEIGDYRKEHAKTASLVIEVADSSLTSDRRDKAPLYAECGIPEYWVVNIAAENVEVYLHPTDGTYDTVDTYASQDLLRPTRLPMVEITVADIF